MKRSKFQIGGLLRITLVIAIILAQLVVLAFIVVNMRNHAIYLFILLEIIGLIEVLTLVDNEVTSSYKIAWTIVILLLPVFGWLLYLLWGKASTDGRKSRKIRLFQARTQYWLQFHDHNHTELTHENPLRRRLARYLESEGFPLYQGTDCQYYRFGETFFTALLDDLRAAQKFIFLEFFIITDGIIWQQIYAVLKEKAAHGVEIRILYDDLGSLLGLPDQLRQLQSADGSIQVLAFNPVHQHIANFYLNYRNHRKSVIIDGQTGYTGGINLADEYANIEQPHGHWKDTGIRLVGDAVWSLTVSFLQMWSAENNTADHKGWHQYRPLQTVSGQGFFQPFTDGPVNNPQNPAEEMYSQMISQAQHYIYISTPYLIIDDAMAGALCTAAQSGVDVRVITPKKGDRWFVHVVTRSNYGRLLKRGVKIYEYTPGFLHAKTIISDDDHAITGSINMDYRSFHLHFENGVWMCNTPVLAMIKQDFCDMFAVSEQIKIDEWQNRPWTIKPIQALLRILSPLL